MEKLKWQSDPKVKELKASIGDYRTRLHEATERFKEAKAKADQVRNDALDVFALFEIGDASEKDVAKAKQRLEKAEAETRKLDDTVRTLERVDDPLQNKLAKVATVARARNREVLEARAEKLLAEAVEHLQALQNIAKEKSALRFNYVENNEPEKNGRVPKTTPGAVGRLGHVSTGWIGTMHHALTREQ